MNSPPERNLGRMRRDAERFAKGVDWLAPGRLALDVFFLLAELERVEAERDAAEAALAQERERAERLISEKGEAEVLLGEIGAGGSASGLVSAIHNLIGMYEAAVSAAQPAGEQP